MKLYEDKPEFKVYDTIKAMQEVSNLKRDMAIYCNYLEAMVTGIDFGRRSGHTSAINRILEEDRDVRVLVATNFLRSLLYGNFSHSAVGVLHFDKPCILPHNKIIVDMGGISDKKSKIVYYLQQGVQTSFPHSIVLVG